MSHVKNGPAIVTAKNVQDGFIDIENVHYAKKSEYDKLNPKDKPRHNDILITKDGTIGRAAIVGNEQEFCINQSVAVLWLESCLLYRPYLLLVLRSPFSQVPMAKAAEGMAIKHLSITDFGMMLLPVPPLAEQKRIVAKVDELIGVIEQIQSNLAAEKMKRELLLQAL